MRILFTSDLHGRISDIENFSRILRTGNYDIGIIGGDIIDDGIPDRELQEYFSSGELKEDDFIEELLDAEKTFEENMNEQIKRLHDQNSPLMQALYLKEKRVKEILDSSERDIFLIPGNHDLTDWEDYKHIKNIHNRRVEFGKLNFVGYKWTKLHRSAEDHHNDIEELIKLVDRKTILVTHEPPFGKLDIGSYESDELEHIGSKELINLVSRKKPKLHLFGHTHSNTGVKGKFINGSFPRVQCFFDIELGISKRVRMIDSRGFNCD